MIDRRVWRLGSTSESRSGWGGCIFFMGACMVCIGRLLVVIFVYCNRLDSRTILRLRRSRYTWT
ncbi:uncharacterized protein BDW47DRAFT_101994 [Aspergillus candidus]|uniref:Uncharacterized protein n=1 Tax=Aspergillus candidus TaxID=41067 RepID=A0A2I2FH51_ASPCN|nr:hypothetical protein BDW47DRAFT_101994 [Aspergillus candidus]PLB39953.1 hypothetical protein BDW47DRAFT_101994 [Aspergillus candidus]